MCGIAGWVDWERDLSGERRVLETMVSTLSNRGPDASGMWLGRRAALGHRRLVVVDPQGGAQPMARPVGDRDCIITYNGELYNTSDLRSQLEALGHHFHSSSDTEVLLVSYIQWGQGCLARLNGIFAFAIWDDRQDLLFMARDRLGVKPLFYALRGSALLFGSEQKALLAHPLVRPEVDAAGLAEVFALGPARSPGHGIYRDIMELRPGHYLECRPRGSTSRRYWSLESRLHQDGPVDTALTIRDLLEDTVRRQLVSDVPVCTLLSGGLDSSAITAVAARALSEGGTGPLRTFSVDYVGNEAHFAPSAFQPDSDADWAVEASSLLGTRHRAVLLDTPQLVDALDAAMRAQDRPGMADVDSSLYLFCKAVKEDATVALSGESADELFGGYPWFHRPECLESNTFPWSLALEERWRVLSREARRHIMPERYVEDRYREAVSEVPALQGEDSLDARMRKISYLNITRFLTTLLDRKDRMSMAAGLEVRVPFCDHRLVEYVWNIPWKMKAQGGVEKAILRRALRGLLPEPILNRRKTPYPKTHNPSYIATVKQRLQAILEDPGSPLVPLVDKGHLQALLASGDALDYPWFGQLMTKAQLFSYLIQCDTWLREYGVTLV